jgi:uncharacterized protein (TIGR03000 family)
MIRKTVSLLLLPTVVVMVLLVWGGPADAAGPVRGGGGGSRGGGYQGGYSGGIRYGGGRVGYPSYANSRYGYSSPYGYRVRPFYGYGVYPYYFGSGYYPYYGSGYTPYSTYPSFGYDSGAVLSPEPLPVQPVAGTGDSATGVLTTVGNTARITVRLSGDADLWFDGVKMTATGPVREFATPELSADRQYGYEIHARWMEGGTTIDQTRKIAFAAGNHLDVSFPTPSGTEEQATRPIVP